MHDVELPQQFALQFQQQHQAEPQLQQQLQEARRVHKNRPGGGLEGQISGGAQQAPRNQAGFGANQQRVLVRAQAERQHQEGAREREGERVNLATVESRGLQA